MGISSINSLKMAGLATGLDTESIVKQMASGTQAKIDKQKQALQLLQWKQEDYRSVIDKISAVKDKYFNLLKPDTNLGSSSLFGKTTSTSTLSSLIVNSSPNAEKTTYNISNIISKAKNAGVTSASKAVDGIKLDFSKAEKGKEYKVAFSLDGLTKEVSFTGGASEADTKKAFLDAVNAKMGSDDLKFNVVNDTMTVKDTKDLLLKHTFGIKATTDDAKELTALGLENNTTSQLSMSSKLSDVAFSDKLKGSTFSFDINGVNFNFSGDTTIGNVINSINKSNAGVKASYDSLGNKFTLETTDSGAGSELKVLQKTGNLLSAMFGESVVSSSPYVGSQMLQSDTLKGAVAEDGKGFGFKDGVSGEVKDLINQSLKVTVNGQEKEITLWQYDAQGKKNDFTKPAAVVTQLNSQLKKEYGDNAPIVSYDGDTKQFSIQTYNPNDTIKIESTGDITGGSDKLMAALGFNNSNNTNVLDPATTKLSDVIKGDLSGNLCFDKDGVTKYTISGNTTIKELVDNSNGMITFENGSFVLKGVNYNACDEHAKTSLANIFGEGYNYPGVPPVHFDESKLTVTLTGSNAVMVINGTEVTSNSNTFDINGTKINIQDVAVGAVDAKVTTTQDTSTAFDAIKNFVEDYNALINDLNTEVDTMRPTDTGKITGTKYNPLTDAQIDDMKEDEVKKWNEKARKGMLYQDSTVTEFLSNLRSTISSGTNIIDLKEMGITISSNYKDNGKLEIDESKLKAALADNPDKIREFFTDSQTGLSAGITKTIDNYVGTSGDTQGRFILLAGKNNTSTSSENSISKQLEEYQERITTLQTKYKSETERYWKQFTQLETMTNKYNSQSEWLASQFSSSNS